MTSGSFWNGIVAQCSYSLCLALQTKIYIYTILKLACDHIGDQYIHSIIIRKKARGGALIIC
jgi:hypothetical protein